MSIIHGNDADSILRPLLVDASGRAIVTLAAGSANIGDVDVLTMPITQVKSSNNNHIFSYESFIGIRVSNQNLSAGYNVIESSAVPANKIWIMTSIGVIYVGTVAGVLLLVYNYINSIPYDYFRQSVVVSQTFYGIYGQFVLPATAKLRAEVFGATAGDDLYLIASGYQMDIS